MRILRITTAAISLRLLLEGQLKYLQEQGFDVLTVSAMGPEVHHLKDSGLAHQIVPMTRQITPLRDLVCLFKIVKVILSYKPDIVHTHTPKAGLLGMVASYLCRVPVRMHTVAGLPLQEAVGWRKWLLKSAEIVTYFCAHHVYPNSKGLFQYIQTTFRTENEFYKGVPKFRMIGEGSSNGIDVSYYLRTEALMQQATNLRSQLAISGREIVFSFVGRVVSHKGISELTEAFYATTKLFPSRLLIVGPLEADLDPLPEETRRYLEREPRVTLAGFQEDIRPWLLASDVFVFPSYREGFPNVVMQAACLEIPCIVSDINGNNEIIENGKTGLVVPAKDVSSLTEAMARLAKDESQRLEFGRCSRDFVVKNFDRKFFWHELLSEYQRLLALN